MCRVGLETHGAAWKLERPAALHAPGKCPLDVPELTAAERWLDNAFQRAGLRGRLLTLAS